MAALLVSSCGGSATSEHLGRAAEAIQGGQRDATDIAVLGLAVNDPAGYVSHTCSATLIAPNLVLTAQHCIADTSPFVACDTSTFGPPVAPALVELTSSTSMWESDAEWMSVAQVLVPPGAPIVCGRDLALLELTRLAAQPVIAPRLESLVAPDERYSAVGYGITSGSADDAGIRRRRDSLAAMCVGAGCGETAEVDGREWRGDHGVCSGDSGGPAVDGEGRLIGVTSRGPEGCDQPIYGGIVAYREWIVASAIQAAEDGEYDPPEWTASVATTSSRLGKPARNTGWESCALGTCPAVPSPADARLALVAALALALGVRRARSRFAARPPER